MDISKNVTKRFTWYSAQKNVKSVLDSVNISRIVGFVVRKQTICS